MFEKLVLEQAFAAGGFGGVSGTLFWFLTGLFCLLLWGGKYLFLFWWVLFVLGLIMPL
jgi:hypothetical protein